VAAFTFLEEEGVHIVVLEPEEPEYLLQMEVTEQLLVNWLAAAEAERLD
jgi:hypothetical protein